MANAPTGGASIGQGALNYNDHSAHVAPALKFPFKAFSVCPNTAGHVTGSLAFHNRAFR